MVDFSRRTEAGRRETSRDEAPRRSTRDEEAPRRSSSRDEEAPRRSRDDDDAPRGRGRGDDDSSGFTYTKRTREQVEKRATMTGGAEFDKIFKDHIKVFSPKKGENRVRFLPATWPKPVHYGWDIFVHYGVGPDRQSYLDLKRMRDEPDPIDDERNELRRAGHTDEAALQLIRDLNSRRRVACYIVDRDNEGEGVQMWAMAQTLDQDISASSVDSETGEVLDIDDPEDGYDVSFRKEGEGLNTKYKGITIARRSSRLGVKGALEYAIKYPIPDQLQFFTYDEIAKEFGAGGSHRERRDDGRSSDREERSSGRTRDREESGSRDDDRGRDRASRDAAPQDDDRGADRGRRGASDRERAEPEITYETVQAMTGAELDALVEAQGLDKINPADAEDDAQLRDWICEDLKLEKPTARESVQRRSAAPAEDTGDKLAEMRASRGRR